VNADMRAELRGNNFDVVRRRNLSILLGRVHALGGISRAQMTRETGLNRSTIADLVGELVQLGLVVEAGPDQTNLVGRPSSVVVPSENIVAITVNPEVDAVTIGLVGLGGRVIRQVRYDTGRVLSAREAVNISAAIIAGMRGELDSSYRTVGIGIAAPALDRGGDGVVSSAPHLKWHDEPIAEMMREATGYTVYVGNDASLGAIAESVRGAGVDGQELVYLNGGASGIGGGVITGGSLMTGTSGYAGEIGHTLVNSNGVECHCGAIGCLETEVRQGPLLEVLGLELSQPDRLDELLRERYAAGDAAVIEVVDRQIGFLARALANVANIFNPQIIVLGGFLGSLLEVAPDALLTLMRRSALKEPGLAVTFARATFGDEILTLGAAEMVFSHLIADPAATMRPAGDQGTANTETHPA